ncbi:MAG: winged helix-turn-helix transcriptional regulator [Thermomicrobiales bacterium]
MDPKLLTTPVAICPRFHYAVELIGRRWTGAILRALLAGATRYSDITQAIPGLSDRLLSERLRELEAEGIVKRTVIPEMPVRIEYHLTEKGASLEPVLVSVSTWAETWIDDRTAEARCDEVERDALRVPKPHPFNEP